MDFSNAKWEMLVAVRNFFRETAADQSIFDELLVVRPPKRIVGGLTLQVLRLPAIALPIHNIEDTTPSVGVSGSFRDSSVLEGYIFQYVMV